MTRRDPDWDLDRVDGAFAEQLAQRLRLETLIGTCEVKNDRRAVETGRLYIETRSLNAGGWMSSGIDRTKADNWALVIGGQVVIWMPTWLLAEVAERVGQSTGCARGSHPTRGTLVEVEDLLPTVLDVLRSETSEAA